MEKLVTLLLLVTFIFGIGLYVFTGNNGGIIKNVKDGQTTITTVVRSNDYVTN